MKTVRMLRDDKGAPQGHTTFRYPADSVHTLPDELAEAFVLHRKSAVYVGADAPAPEAKGDAPAAEAPAAVLASSETLVVGTIEAPAEQPAEPAAAADDTPAAEPAVNEPGAEAKGDARRRRR